MHYDNTYNRLKTLNEYIKDTEDLVNIKLDQHRNQLITTDLILTALTCSMAIVTTVSGIFGMNLDSGLQVSELMERHAMLNFEPSPVDHLDHYEM